MSASAHLIEETNPKDKVSCAYGVGPLK